MKRVSKLLSCGLSFCLMFGIAGCGSTNTGKDEDKQREETTPKVEISYDGYMETVNKLNNVKSYHLQNSYILMHTEDNRVKRVEDFDVTVGEVNDAATGTYKDISITMDGEPTGRSCGLRKQYPVDGVEGTYEIDSEESCEGLSSVKDGSLYIDEMNMTELVRLSSYLVLKDDEFKNQTFTFKDSVWTVTGYQKSGETEKIDFKITMEVDAKGYPSKLVYYREGKEETSVIISNIIE